jgi:hypothetical protein
MSSSIKSFNKIRPSGEESSLSCAFSEKLARTIMMMRKMIVEFFISDFA